MEKILLTYNKETIKTTLVKILEDISLKLVSIKDRFICNQSKNIYYNPNNKIKL